MNQDAPAVLGTYGDDSAAYQVGAWVPKGALAQTFHFRVLYQADIQKASADAAAGSQFFNVCPLAGLYITQTMNFFHIYNTSQ